MSEASRKLDAGARVVTDFSSRLTTHTIVQRKPARGCQSGILFQVRPEVPGSKGGWIDADWFEPWS